MHILLAEDDEMLGNRIVYMLKKESYAVDWVFTGKDAYQYASDLNYDVIILDWMMPSGDGASVCYSLRNDGFQGGILMLTAKDSFEDRVRGLDVGADDYLVKPFAFSELFARIRSVYRRCQSPIQKDVLQIDNLRLDCNSHTVIHDGREIRLTPREYEILKLLMNNHGQVVPKETILDRVWGYDSAVTNNTLEAFVKLLRKKIECSHDQKLIHNIRGVGYKLEVQ